MSINDNTPIGNMFKKLPTGNIELDRQLIAIFNKYNDTKNMSILLELSILAALYPNDMNKILV